MWETKASQEKMVNRVTLETCAECVLWSPSLRPLKENLGPVERLDFQVQLGFQGPQE